MSREIVHIRCARCDHPGWVVSREDPDTTLSDAFEHSQARHPNPDLDKPDFHHTWGEINTTGKASPSGPGVKEVKP